MMRGISTHGTRMEWSVVVCGGAKISGIYFRCSKRQPGRQNEGGRGRRIIENTNRANKNNGRKHLGIYCETCRFFASFFLFTYTCFSTLHDTGNLALTDGLYVHIRGRIIFHERHKKYFIRFIRKIDFSNFSWKCSIRVSSL